MNPSSEPGVTILGANGQPLRPSKAQMLAGGTSNTAYDAADVFSQHFAGWNPNVWSPDNEINMFRDRMVARIRDLVRNDGWASGLVTRILDNAMGAVFRPLAKPDWRSLQAITGNKAYDNTWATEYGKTVDALYRVWAEDEGCWCDAARKNTMAQNYRLAFRHKIVDGDALAQMKWIPERVGPGKARYATCMAMIDPDRLSNPQNRFDLQLTRGGVEVDLHGAAVAYHIREAHPTDWYDAQRSMTWQRIARETSWGRPIIVHDYDTDRAAQHRGMGILGPVVQRLKALITYDGAELDSAILNAIFAAYIESPNDPQMVEQALGSDELGAYQDMRSKYHDEKRLTIDGARMPILFPGEKITTVDAVRPTSNYAGFEKAVLRNVASAAGMSAQQVSQDWSDVNYSSARAAMLEAYKTMDRRILDFAMGFARRPRAAWLEEVHEVESQLPLPANAVPFIEARTAYARAKWMGPGMGWIDPVAEKEGAVLGMEAGLSTLEQECAAHGVDWEDNLDQRVEELAGYKDRNLDPPASWLANRPAEVARAPGEGKDTAGGSK